MYLQTEPSGFMKELDQRCSLCCALLMLPVIHARILSSPLPLHFHDHLPHNLPPLTPSAYVTTRLRHRRQFYLPAHYAYAAAAFHALAMCHANCLTCRSRYLDDTSSNPVPRLRNLLPSLRIASRHATSTLTRSAHLCSSYAHAGRVPPPVQPYIRRARSNHHATTNYLVAHPLSWLCNMEH